MNNSIKLKVAAIMDEFTYCCFAPSCELMQLTPNNCVDEIDNFNPDLMFIETACLGKDGLWRHKVNDNLETLTNLVSYCKGKHITVVFWSKEDPVCFGLYCGTAALADYVFTTDAECVELYKSHLGHNRVYFLPFAAQPAQHNPVEEYEREDKFCFAGSFYSRYKERSQSFLDLAPLFVEHGLDIYDRNYNNDSGLYPGKFNYPAELQKCVLGGLPYSEITRAYKGYKYGINMTSMVQSGYMFARRVFELLACNTVVVSNYSRGLELFFGDLIIETNDREHMKDQLDKFCVTELGYRKYRLAGLRHVLSSHLYEDRLDRIAQKALGRSIKKPLPKILVVCCKENEKIRNMFDSQTYESKQLVVADNVTKLSDYQFDYVTIFSENDYYGKNYLTDFALATRFASDDVIGKCAYYSDGKVVNIEKAYMRVTEEIKLNRQMVAKAMFEDTTTLADLFAFNKAAEILSLDEFNYCENADSYDDADDIEIYTGIPIEEIYEYTDRIPPVELKKNKEISVKELYDELIIKDSDLVTKSFENGNMKLVREADDDKVVWLYTNKTYNVDDYAVNDHIGFYPESVDKTGIVRCQIEYYDENEIKLGFLNFVIDGFTLLYITNRAKSFKLIFRMRGKSSLTLKKMYSASSDHIFAAPLPVRKNLLITEIYPDYDDRENGRKLHEFAKENNLEVFKVGETLNYLPYSEYEGVQITSSRYSAIKEYINARDFDCIYVSSDSQKVKEYLADYKGRIVTI